MAFAFTILGAWATIAAFATIPRVRGSIPAVVPALLAGGVFLIAFGFWLNDFLTHAVAALHRAKAGDTYYVFAQGHHSIMSGIVLLLLAAAAFWLHRRAAPLAWRAARVALWLSFALSGAQVALNTSLPPPGLLPNAVDLVTRNWLASILALASFVALWAIGLCLVHDLWRTIARRS